MKQTRLRNQHFISHPHEFRASTIGRLKSVSNARVAYLDVCPDMILPSNRMGANSAQTSGSIDTLHIQFICRLDMGPSYTLRRVGRVGFGSQWLTLVPHRFDRIG